MKTIEQKLNDLNKKKQQWEKEKQYLEQKQKLKQQKKEFLHKDKKKISVSKILTFFLFANCTAIEIFTCYITILNIKMASQLGTAPDLSPLIALISAAVGEVIGFGIYAIKAAKQNCEGGIVYEQALLQTMKENEYRQESIYGKDY